MPRNRVLSFMSQWGGPPRSPTSDESPGTASLVKQDNHSVPVTQPPSSQKIDGVSSNSPTPSQQQRQRSDSRPNSRPTSMLQTYQPPTMDVPQDTLPELQPIFTFLNSHSNKLYQEGYFLKLHDLDTRGRPSPDRTWNECFAQLVGTVLSIWDAAQLDAAGEDGEVTPSFINVADASIKMIESLPMSESGQPLQNVLSISTAAANRYLLHFNSLNSLTQWTAGIRLAMYEHATLQEAYTGSLIAGKGKHLNNIRTIMEKTRFKYEDWTRVRFGAGTPWRRCWCVITPPDEKEYARLQKQMKKQTIYDRQKPVLKGDIKFYESKKITKKTRPIATITDAYSAYAIYPQSKPLIDQSTLVKIEGLVTIHSTPESTTEGFVFVMPETHPAVSGFELMLRFLFPVFDVFTLYGRPDRLVADVLDTRSLMFAMPRERRYGYLEILDVSGLIHTEGSSNWNERQWRKQMKDLTSKRMTSTPSRDRSNRSSRRNTMSRTSLPPSRNGTIRFEESGSVRSQPPTRKGSPVPAPETIAGRTGSEPNLVPTHKRSVSESTNYRSYQSETPSRLAYGTNMSDRYGSPPAPLIPSNAMNGYAGVVPHEGYDTVSEGGYKSSPEYELPHNPMALPEFQAAASASNPPAAVAAPPAFAHGPSQRPATQPMPSPDMRRANAQLDDATLRQLAETSNRPLPNSLAIAGAAMAMRGSPDGHEGRKSGEGRGSGEYNYYRQGNQGSDYMNARAHNRLPTIPASPYIEQSEPSPGPAASFQPSAPPVPEHGEAPSHPMQPPNNDASGDRPHTPTSLSSSYSVHRKPVPGQAPSLQRDIDASSTSGSSFGSLRNNVIDPESLDRLAEIEPSTEPSSVQRSATMSSSVYESDVTPDYASTASAATKESKESIEKPRAGKLKTVGTVQPAPPPEVIVGDIHYGGEHAKKEEPSIDLPTIDFGPTYVVTPGSTSRPGTSGTITQTMLQGSPRSRGDGTTNTIPGPDSFGNLKDDYFGKRADSPNVAAHRRAHSHSPKNDLSGLTPDPSAKADNRRSVAWTPGMVGQHNRSSTLTPEEWVQQRAIGNGRTPTYAHGRNSTTPTPPLSRNASGDWTQLAQRTPPRDDRPPSRPHSRGASVLMNPTQGLIHGDYSKQLSAREQEYVSRTTGTPLIQMAKNNAHERTQSAGLVGAIDMREKEKQQIREGTRGALVQHAIASKQQQQHAQEAQARETARRQAQAQQQAQMQAKLQVQAQMQAQQQAMMYGVQQSPYMQTPAQQSPYGFQQPQGYVQQPGYAQAPAWAAPVLGGYGFPQQQQQQQSPQPQAYGASWDQQQVRQQQQQQGRR